MLRSALAVVTGYIFASTVQLVATLALDRQFGYDIREPQLDPSFAWIAFNFVLAFVCYFAGSYIMAVIARTEIGRHALYMTAVMIVFNVGALVAARGGQPFWFSIAMLVLPILGIAAGSRVRAAQGGDRTES